MKRYLLAAALIATVPAHASPLDCRQAAAHQVSGEPGIAECFSHNVVSADCRAVIHASMQKRLHECEEAKRAFNIR